MGRQRESFRQQGRQRIRLKRAGRCVDAGQAVHSGPRSQTVVLLFFGLVLAVLAAAGCSRAETTLCPTGVRRG